MKLINLKIHDKPDNAIYIGRPSPLGNPFVIGKHGSREEVIAKYKTWLHNRVLECNRRVLEALKKLTDDSVLVCYCSPLQCHGEIVIEIWTELMQYNDFEYGLNEYIKKFSK